MATFTNYLMNLLKNKSAFSITDQQENVLLKDLKIKSVTIFENADSSNQPINVTQSQLKTGYKSYLYYGENINNEMILNGHTYSYNTDTDITYTKVIHPSHLNITCFSPNLLTNQLLMKLFKDCLQTYNITSKNVKINNLVITSLEFGITPEHLNIFPVRIYFQEVFYSNKTYSPLNDADQNTTTMNITPTSAKTTIKNVVNQLFKNIV